ncbi:MAG: esterase [Pseudomonadales bacterium]|nr:esterase [Pseudomonadales bacterium]
MYEKLYQKEFAEPSSTGSSSHGPSTWDTATELPRVMLEMTSLTYTWPLLGASPRGDGHTVMVLPGFTAGDQSTLVLRRLLQQRNYRSLPWMLGQNTGSFELQDRLITRFQAVLAESNGKVSLIGQSLGGVFARILARQWPERIRQVITLGSPFGSSGPETVNSLVSRLFQRVSGMSPEEMRDQMLDLRAEPLPVPSTAIYSRSDGVVHWSTCIDRSGTESENIEVVGSHSGMAFNPLVLHALLDRLAQRDGQWQPFRRNTLCRSLLYPVPAKL